MYMFIIIALDLCATVSVLLQTCLSLGGGGVVAVACGVRLARIVLLGTVLLLSVSLVAGARFIALRLQVYTKSGNTWYI